jgi:hypothetical protein
LESFKAIHNGGFKRLYELKMPGLDKRDDFPSQRWIKSTGREVEDINGSAVPENPGNLRF